MSGKRIKSGKKKKKRQSSGVSPPQSLSYMLAEAIRLQLAGNLAHAETRYRQILQSDPQHADALHLLGVIAYQKGDYSRAVEYIEKAVTVNPSAHAYHNNLGNTFLNLNKTDDALGCFKEALHLKPDYVEPYNNMGNALRKQGRNEEAANQYRKAIDLNPEYVPAINNLASLLKEQGRLDEALVHYRKAVTLNPDLAEAYLNLGNLLKDQGRLDEALMHYRKAVTLKPDLAEAHFSLGNALEESDKPDEAIVQYNNALSVNPDFAEVHNNLGNVLKMKREYDKAIEHYSRAISLNPGLAEAYNNLGDAYREQSRFDEAVALCQRALQIKPESVEAYVTAGNIFLDQGNFSEAIDSYQRAIDLRPDSPDAHYNKGLVLLLKGEFEEGWKEYEWRFQSRTVSKDIGYREIRIPLWDGSALGGKTIVIMSEQGAGDNMQFARYLPFIKARGGRVVFECPKELMRLFEGHEGIDVLMEKPYNSGCGEMPDVCSHLISLPGIFGTTLNSIVADVPYVNVAPEVIRKWKPHVGSELFKVGLVWSGNPRHRNDRNRSCTLSDFAPVMSVPGVTFFSLQKGTISDIADGTPAGVQIADLGKDLGDFCDTAAAIESLDLVISVDTSVAHLAGALGKQVWTLLPCVPDWRWMLNRNDTPWYPTMRLFRQPTRGDWGSVMEQAAAELNNLAEKK